MSEQFVTISQHVRNPQEAAALFGVHDIHLKRIEEELGVSIVTRGETVNVSGAPQQVQLVDELLRHLLIVIRKGAAVSERDVLYAIQLAKKGALDGLVQLYDEEITKNAKGKPIRVKTLGQRYYVAAIEQYDLTFGIGPAGTGKTYLAVVMAVKALKTAVSSASF
ncbi:PhoH-like protein [Geobacillus sp. BCO2]|nr:PhoH-like protein [Geobacillus sp. BCO2]